jgi:hypothetical protein
VSDRTGTPDTTGRAGDVGQYAGPAHPHLWVAGAIGHSTASHEAFGWCCLDYNRSVDEELWAWRLRHQREDRGNPGSQDA